MSSLYQASLHLSRGSTRLSEPLPLLLLLPCFRGRGYICVIYLSLPPFSIESFACTLLRDLRPCKYNIGHELSDVCTSSNSMTIKITIAELICASQYARVEFRKMRLH